MNSALLALFIALPSAEPIPSGLATHTVATGAGDLKVYTYRPETFEPKLLVLVFHGTLRNAAEYRTWAKPIAVRARALVAAPEFDEKRFASGDYHRGGLVDRDGVTSPIRRASSPSRPAARRGNPI